MEKLNQFEEDILRQFVKKYPYLERHIPVLMIKNRDYTGVGMYINFAYLDKVDDLPIDETSLGTDGTITMDGLKYDLIYELDISKSKINFLEIVTCGEAWDGTIKDYAFI